jgi:hypothetical protein
VFLNIYIIFSEILKVLNGFIEERGWEWKNLVGVCTDVAACLTADIQVWPLKLRIWWGDNLLTTHCYIHRQNLACKKRHMSLIFLLLVLVRSLLLVDGYSTLNTLTK